jgi:hypothetical protein
LVCKSNGKPLRPSILPGIKVDGLENPPVIQIIDKKKRNLYTVRMNGFKFRSKVFKAGRFTLIPG